MPFGITYVRVADEFGNHYSLVEGARLPEGHTILKDHPATNSNGDPLPVKEKTSKAATSKGEASSTTRKGNS